jgi:hypothetical protein
MEKRWMGCGLEKKGVGPLKRTRREERQGHRNLRLSHHHQQLPIQLTQASPQNRHHHFLLLTLPPQHHQTNHQPQLPDPFLIPSLPFASRRRHLPHRRFPKRNQRARRRYDLRYRRDRRSQSLQGQQDLSFTEPIRDLSRFAFVILKLTLVSFVLSLASFVILIFQNLCLDKANRLGIKTARLPIGTYLASLPTRKVLTVNQVRSFLSPSLPSLPSR